MRTTPDGVLIIHAVADRPIGVGSVVQVVLYDPWKGARSDVQGDYDLASLREVEFIHGPFSNPPRWMITYRGKVSAEYGDRIRRKEQKGDLVGFVVGSCAPCGQREQ